MINSLQCSGLSTTLPASAGAAVAGILNGPPFFSPVAAVYVVPGVLGFATSVDATFYVNFGNNVLNADAVLAAINSTTFLAKVKAYLNDTSCAVNGVPQFTPYSGAATVCQPFLSGGRGRSTRLGAYYSSDFCCVDITTPSPPTPPAPPPPPSPFPSPPPPSPPPSPSPSPPSPPPPSPPAPPSPPLGDCAVTTKYYINGREGLIDPALGEKIENALFLNNFTVSGVAITPTATTGLQYAATLVVWFKGIYASKNSFLWISPPSGSSAFLADAPWIGTNSLLSRLAKATSVTLFVPPTVSCGGSMSSPPPNLPPIGGLNSSTYYSATPFFITLNMEHNLYTSSNGAGIRLGIARAFQSVMLAPVDVEFISSNEESTEQQAETDAGTGAVTGNFLTVIKLIFTDVPSQYNNFIGRLGAVFPNQGVGSSLVQCDFLSNYVFADYTTTPCCLTATSTNCIGQCGPAILSNCGPASPTVFGTPVGPNKPNCTVLQSDPMLTNAFITEGIVSKYWLRNTTAAWWGICDPYCDYNPVKNPSGVCLPPLQAQG